MACVFKRRGRWVVDFRDPQGYRHTLVVQGTRKDADARLAKIVSDIHRGDFIPFHQRKSFEELVEKFFRAKVAEVSQNTAEDYQRLTRLHLQPFFARFPIQKIRRETVEDFRSELHEKGIGPRTINKSVGLLGSFFRYAVAHQWLSRSPTAGLKKLSEAKKTQEELMETNVLNPEEIRRLLGVYGEKDGRWKIVVKAAVFTGLREGELLGMQWRDIDWRTKQIHVTRQYTRGRFSELKTRSSRRSVDMANALIADLRRWWGPCPKGTLNLVFPNGVGNPESHANLLQRGFYPFLEKADLTRIRFHDLRHTYASLMIANGEHPKYIQQQMGHSSVKVTMDIYGHLMQSSNPQAAEKLADLVLGRTELVTKW